MEALNPARFAHLAKMHVIDGTLKVDTVQYLRLSHWVTIKFIQKRPAWKVWEDEFHDEAIFGLLRAVENFEPDKGVKFVTYGAHVIYRWLHEVANDWASTRPTMSLDYRESYGEKSLAEMLPPKEEPEESLEEMHSEAARLLTLLSVQERTVIEGKYWKKQTLRQIGDELGISYQTVSNIELRALQSMGLKSEKRTQRKRRSSPSTIGDRIMKLTQELGPECRYEDALPFMRRLGCVIREQTFRHHMARAFPNKAG